MKKVPDMHLNIRLSVGVQGASCRSEKQHGPMLSGLANVVVRRPICRVEADLLAHHIVGSLLHFLVNLGDVFPEDTEYEKKDAEHEDDERDNGPVTGEGHASDKDLDNRKNEVGQGCPGQEDPQQGDESDRHVRKGEYSLQRQLEDVKGLCVGFAPEPLSPFVFDADGAETQPGEHATGETVPFVHVVNGLVNLFAHQPEVADVPRNQAACQVVDDEVKELRVEASQDPFPGPSFHNAVDVLVTLFPFRYQLSDRGRLVLKVRRHDDCCIALCVSEPSCDPAVHPEIPRKPHDLESGVFLTDLEHAFIRGVGGPVLNHDDFEIIAAILLEHSAQLPCQFSHILLLVEGRCYYRNKFLHFSYNPPAY